MEQELELSAVIGFQGKHLIQKAIYSANFDILIDWAAAADCNS